MPKAVEWVEAIVVGAGQAGLAMSRHLRDAGIAHRIFERERIAERWRSARWDSLVANGPAWHDRFPDREFGGDPEDFPGKDTVADYFEAYAHQIDAPVRCGVEVLRAERRDGESGFRVETTAGVFDCAVLIAATGAFQVPQIPDMVPQRAGLSQLHSTSYRSPQALAEGAVLVVGAGSSGTQIADELNRAGREVYLCVGAHERPPRRYRGRDFVWWLGVLNLWDAETQPGQQHTTIAVSGADGGRTIDFRRLAHEGITLLGPATGCEGGVLRIGDALRAHLEAGDANYLALLDQADAWVARNGVELPEEFQARAIPPDPHCVREPLRELDLTAAGVSTVIWATGFGVDYRWLPAGALDAQGRPRHQRGVSVEPGVYFLGLPWQTRRGSSFIWGVWYDARAIADHIVKQRRYLAYRPRVQ